MSALLRFKWVLIDSPQGHRLGTLRSAGVLYLFRMPTHHSWGKREGQYFCTFTCWEWLPLIEETRLYDSIYAWMRLITDKGCAITGYVLMPNHVHLLLFVPEGMSVNTILSNAKRFLA